MIFFASIVAVLCLAAGLYLLRLSQQPQKNQVPQEEPVIQPSRTCDPIPVQLDVDTEDEFHDIPTISHVEIKEEPEEEEEKTPAPAPTGTSKHRANNARFNPLGNLFQSRRKQWAEKHDFEYRKKDEDLIDEWVLGPAATGANITNIVSGHVKDYEMYLADVGTTTVMALRRENNTAEIILALKDSKVPFITGFGEDILPAGSLGDYELSTTESLMCTQVFINDDSFKKALTNMPFSTTAVWIEGNWVLAAFNNKSNPQQWEQAWDSLVSIADLGHILPPRALPRVEEPLQTRPLPTPMRTLDVVDEPVQQPPVLRPMEPVEYPTRTEGISLGESSFDNELGGDEVLSIAEDLLKSKDASNDGTRIVRNQPDESNIFYDNIAHLDEHRITKKEDEDGQ